MLGPRARVRPRRPLGLLLQLGPLLLLLLLSPPASCQLPRRVGEAQQLQQQGPWLQQQQQLGPTARLYPSNQAQQAQSIGGPADKQRQLPPELSRAQQFHQQPRHHHQHHPYQQQHPLEYYDEEYYDEPEPAVPPLPPQREPKTAYSANANSNPVYDDSYYYDDDYEEEPPKPGIKGQPRDDPPDKQEKRAGPKESAASEAPATSSTSTSPLESSSPTSTTTPTTTTTSTTTPSTTTSTTTEKPEPTSKQSILIGEAIVSVVTTKSVVNGTYSIPESTTSLPVTESTEAASTSSTSTTTQGTTSTSTSPTTSTASESSSTTEQPTTRPSSTTIQPSVQTGRSVSGARFLPFPSVVDKVEQLDSTESINDKLDRVQSELSSGFLANNRFVPRRYNKKPFSVTSLTLPTTSTTLAPTSSPIAPIAITSIATKRPKTQTTLDDLESFLPKDYTKRGPTTLTPPVITKRPKLQTTLEDVEAFLPKDYPRGGFSTSSSSSTSTTSSTGSTTKASGGTTKRPRLQTTLDDLEAFLPKDYKSSYRNKRPGYKTTSTSTTTEASTTAQVAAGSSTERSSASTRPKTLTTIEDIAAFLPPGYKLRKEDATTEKSVILSEILAKTKIAESKEGSAVTTSTSTTTEKAKSIQDLFAKSQVDISALLPPGYKPEASSPKPDDTEPSDDPLSKLLEKSSVDISALLPPGYKPDADESKSTKEANSEVEATAASSDKAPNEEAASKGGQQPFKVVFPSRPGGRKPLPKTGPASHAANRPSAAETTPAPKIHKGWPTRVTTEFTGWPTSSTTPIPIEKLLEAARTATIGSVDVSRAQPTTSEASSAPSSSTTTSTTTLRPTTPGICDDGCEVAGTIRIVDNAEWLPELLDRNTREWQELGEEIKTEMNAAFGKSSVLKKWYRNLRIDSFSQGASSSVLVDFFVELADMKEKIDTQQLKLLFHESVRKINPDDPLDFGIKGPMKLGKFTLDHRSTDFVVVPRVAAPKVSDDDKRLIPQWAIAMIVMGVGGLLFTIVFGVSVLVNRQQGSKLKPSITAMFEEEAAKNAAAAAAAAASMAHHGAHSPSRPSSSDYHKSHTMWSDAGWHDKPFESSSHKILVDGPAYERKYNMYDSWKSEWNGYYYHPTHAGGSNYSRHHPDYDMNF